MGSLQEMLWNICLMLWSIWCSFLLHSSCGKQKFCIGPLHFVYWVLWIFGDLDLCEGEDRLACGDTEWPVLPSGYAFQHCAPVFSLQTLTNLPACPIPIITASFAVMQSFALNLYNLTTSGVLLLIVFCICPDRNNA